MDIPPMPPAKANPVSLAKFKLGYVRQIVNLADRGRFGDSNIDER
jgi:hypothetical protein